MTTRMLRLDEVKKRVGMSRSMIYRLIKEGKFPSQKKIQPPMSHWLEPDIEDWLRNKIINAALIPFIANLPAFDEKEPWHSLRPPSFE